MALIYFLLVYDARNGTLRACEEYLHADRAMTDFARLEADNQADEDVQVVLLSSESLDTLKATHGHYFTDSDSESSLMVLSGA